MKIVIMLVSAAAASMVVTLIMKSLDIEGSNVIGGGVGSFVGLKLFSKQGNGK